MYNTKSNERDKTKNIINNYSTSNLMTLINSFMFTKRERSINETFQ